MLANRSRRTLAPVNYTKTGNADDPPAWMLGALLGQKHKLENKENREPTAGSTRQLQPQQKPKALSQRLAAATPACDPGSSAAGTRGRGRPHRQQPSLVPPLTAIASPTHHNDTAAAGAGTPLSTQTARQHKRSAAGFDVVQPKSKTAKVSSKGTGTAVAAAGAADGVAGVKRGRGRPKAAHKEEAGAVGNPTTAAGGEAAGREAAGQAAARGSSMGLPTTTAGHGGVDQLSEFLQHQAEYRSQIMLFEERKRRKLQELSRLAEEQEAYVARMDEASKALAQRMLLGREHTQQDNQQDTQQDNDLEGEALMHIERHMQSNNSPPRSPATLQQFDVQCPEPAGLSSGPTYSNRHDINQQQPNASARNTLSKRTAAAAAESQDDGSQDVKDTAAGGGQSASARPKRRTAVPKRYTNGLNQQLTRMLLSSCDIKLGMRLLCKWLDGVWWEAQVTKLGQLHEGKRSAKLSYSSGHVEDVENIEELVSSGCLAAHGKLDVSDEEEAGDQVEVEAAEGSESEGSESEGSDDGFDAAEENAADETDSELAGGGFASADEEQGDWEGENEEADSREWSPPAELDAASLWEFIGHVEKVAAGLSQQAIEE